MERIKKRERKKEKKKLHSRMLSSAAAAAEPTGNWQFQKTFSFLAFCLLIERGRNVVHKKVSFFQMIIRLT